MSQRAIDVYEAAIELPEAEFVELLQLLNGPQSPAPPDSNPVFSAELKRRMEGYRNGSIEAVSWEEFDATVEQQLCALESSHEKD